MPPGGVGQGCTAQGKPPSASHRGCHDCAPPHSPPPFLATERKKKKKVKKDHSPPIPYTEEQEPHPVGSLPADVLTEILPRVPYRSLCRFKCVSKPWLALCSDPDIRKRCPQTLSGFFFHTYSGRSGFRNLSGRGTPMVDPFLPFLRESSYNRFNVEGCCGGLLLCECSRYRPEKYKHAYVVCNPMTGKWTVLPPILSQDEEGGDYVRVKPIMEMFLGFDTAIPSCFTVFAPLTYYRKYGEFKEMAIFSSKTGRWITVETDPTTLDANSGCVFLNGTMHLATNHGSIVTFDTKGENWGEINMPDHMSSSKSSKVFIGQSRGQLYAWQIYIYDGDDYGDAHLYVWVLKDYNNSGKWTLMYNVSVPELFGRERGEDDFSYTAFAIHPQSNCIFLTDEEQMTVSYDMDNQKVSVICTLKEFKDVLPYVPCFAEWPSDGH
uniref:Uncharacterized protein n=2 Tax=Avena sativa TaxID=4498 RepID=A0ACD5W7T3_AVESA